MFRTTHKWTPARRKCIIVALLAFCSVCVILALALSLTLTRDKKGVVPPKPETPPASYEWPDPVAMVGTIPNNPHYITMDPSLIRRSSDNKLFLFTTGGLNGSVWTADSVYGPWRKQAQTMLDEHAGAPQVYYLNGTYYMFHNSHQFNYASVGVTNPAASSRWHDASILVRSSTTLEHGSWKPHGRLNITWAMKYNILDPSILTIENTTTGETQNLLAFGSYQTGLFQIPLTDPPVALAENAMEHMTHLEWNQTRTHQAVSDRTEATYQYFRDGWYYLFFSSGRCCPSLQGSWDDAFEDPYRIMVCRSTDPRGEFVDKDDRDCLTQDGGTELLGSHGDVFVPGGQGVTDDWEVGTIIYYHYGE